MLDLFLRKTGYLSSVARGTGNGIIEAIATAFADPSQAVKFNNIISYSKNGTSKTSNSNIGSNALGSKLTTGAKSNQITVSLNVQLTDATIAGIAFTPFSQNIKERLDLLWHWYEKQSQLYYLGAGGKANDIENCVIANLNESKGPAYGRTNIDIQITLQKITIKNTAGAGVGAAGKVATKEVSDKVEEGTESILSELTPKGEEKKVLDTAGRQIKALL